MNNTSLSLSKCIPCSGSTPKLNETEIINNLKKINNWNVNDQQEMIFKKFTFNFKILFYAHICWWWN